MFLFHFTALSIIYWYLLLRQPNFGLSFLMAKFNVTGCSYMNKTTLHIYCMIVFYAGRQSRYDSHTVCSGTQNSTVQRPTLLFTQWRKCELYKERLADLFFNNHCINGFPSLRAIHHSLLSKRSFYSKCIIMVYMYTYCV